MPSTFFSWRPKLIRIGRKPPEHSVSAIATNEIDTIVEDEPVPVALPPSSVGNGYISDTEYSQDFVSDNTFLQPRTARNVHFSEGVGTTSSPTATVPKPSVVVTSRPPSILVQNNGPNVAPQTNLPPPVHMGLPNRSSWSHESIPMPPSSSMHMRIQSPMAPLAREEMEEMSAPQQPPRPPKTQFHNNGPGQMYRSSMATTMSHQPRENRANVLLQQLRADDGAQSESDVSTNEPTSSAFHNNRSQGTIVFLQYNDEVKRAQLPPNIRTVEQIKGLFLRSFPTLSHYYLSQPHVKVYIQESAKGQLFYELDDVFEIKDKAVLKIREQNNSGYQSPPPVRFTDHPPPTIADYVSEPEIDNYRERSNRLNSSYRYRPASAVPGDSGRMFNPNSLKQLRSPAGSTSGRFDSYYDPYSSDASSQGPRSGSVTPIIDKETRFRMDTMERQLAGLSTLVHSALVSKGVSENTQKEMMDLRRQILEFHPEVNRFSEAASEPQIDGSTAESASSSIYKSTPEAQRELQSIKEAIQGTQEDLTELKKAAQLNVQASQDLISEAFSKIRHSITNQQQGERAAALSPLPFAKPDDNLAEKLRTEHLSQLSELQSSLRSFEGNVETIRRSVLNSNRKLRMTEVEQLTNSLTKIGRQAARLKTQFPDLQGELEKRIKKDMERIVQEQNFIKDETSQIDGCLRRCKTLANMMVTMKKLAMVQDPVISAQKGRDDGKPPICAKSPVRSLKAKENSPAPKASILADTTTPQIPPAPANYERPSFSNTSLTNGVKPPADNPTSHVLDNILDELNSTNASKTKRGGATAVTATLTCKVPPRPPERNDSSAESIKHYNYLESRVRLDTPNGHGLGMVSPPLPIQQTNALFDNNSSNTELNRLSAISSTESINSQEGMRERSAILVNNKERIDDKQKELNSQLEKLQQLCPTL